MDLCETHNRLRCGECAYIEELKEERDHYRGILEDLIEVLTKPGMPQLNLLADEIRKDMEVK